MVSAAKLFVVVALSEIVVADLSCSLPYRVNGKLVRLKCGGPESVDAAIDDAEEALVTQGDLVEACPTPWDAKCIRRVLVDASRPARWEHLLDDATDESVVIVSASDRPELSNGTWPSWQRYAEKYGFGHLRVSRVTMNRSAHWTKIALLRALMDDDAARYELIIFVDDDVVVTNFDIDVTALPLGDDTLGLVEDPLLAPPSFNSGVIVAKRPGDRVRDLLDRTWLAPFDDSDCWLDECPFWDQSALQKAAAASSDVIIVLPYRTLQSFFNGPTCAYDWIDHDCDLHHRELAWRPGDFAAHISGYSLDHRLKRLQLIHDAEHRSRRLLDDDDDQAPFDLATHRQILIELILGRHVTGEDVIRAHFEKSTSEEGKKPKWRLIAPLLTNTTYLEAVALDIFHGDQAQARSAYHIVVDRYVHRDLLASRPPDTTSWGVPPR